MLTKTSKKMSRKAKQMIKQGRLPNGRIAWNSQVTQCCLTLAEWGLHYETIAKKTGLSKGALAYRFKKAGVRVRTFREGKNNNAEKIMKNWTLE